MIVGTRFWNDRKTFHIQDNNSMEEAYRKKYASKFLEDCGPTSAINAIASLKGPEFFDSIKIGQAVFQPEDLLALFFNDPNNYSKFREIRPDVDPARMMCNEIPQYYPYAVDQLFNAKCEFVPGSDWSGLAKYLMNGHAVQLVEPGHFTCAVAYDTDTNEVIYNDPWAGHYIGRDEFNLRYSETYFEKHMSKFMLVYSL